MKNVMPILMMLTLSLVGCTQEQATQPEEPVGEAESSAHKAVETESGDSYSPYTRGYPQRVLLVPEVADSGCS